MMPLQMTATDVREISPGIWAFDMPPHQIRYFGNTNHSIGTQSVLVFNSCNYEAAKKQLQFDADDVTPLNIGTSSRVIGLAAEPNDTNASDNHLEKPTDQISLSPGDREFLLVARSELSTGTARVAENLLLGVRKRSPGNLKRGQSRNFSETPDNFWYIIVQPRIDELSITVRGSLEHFKPVAKLEVKDDRGNTRFKVRAHEDVEAALEIIFHAVRKA